MLAKQRESVLELNDGWNGLQMISEVVISWLLYKIVVPQRIQDQTVTKVFLNEFRD